MSVMSDNHIEMHKTDCRVREWTFERKDPADEEPAYILDLKQTAKRLGSHWSVSTEGWLSVQRAGEMHTQHLSEWEIETIHKLFLTATYHLKSDGLQRDMEGAPA